MKIELLDPVSVLSMPFHVNAIVLKHCSMVVVYSEITISIESKCFKANEFINGIVL